MTAFLRLRRPLDGAAVPANDPVNPGHLEVLVVVGADGSFELLEDDDAATGTPARTRIGFDQDRGVAEVVAANGAVDALPAARTWTVTFPAFTATADPVATVDGTPDPARVVRAATRTSVTVEDVAATATLRTTLGPRPAPDRNDAAVRLSHLHALDLEPALLTADGEILLAQVQGLSCPGGSGRSCRGCGRPRPRGAPRAGR